MSRFAAFTVLCVLAALALTGCQGENSDPVLNQLHNQLRACKKVKHVEYFPECYNRHSKAGSGESRKRDTRFADDDLVPVVKGSPAPSAWVLKVWRGADPTWWIVSGDDGEKGYRDHYSDKRVKLAGACQRDKKWAKHYVCWGRTGDGKWFPLKAGSRAGADALGLDQQPAKRVRDKWLDECGKLQGFCEIDSGGGKSNDPTYVVNPPPASAPYSAPTVSVY